MKYIYFAQDLIKHGSYILLWEAAYSYFSIGYMCTDKLFLQAMLSFKCP